MPKAMNPVPGTPISNGASNICGAKINKITPRITDPKQMAHQEMRTEIVKTQIDTPSITQKVPAIFSIIFRLSFVCKFREGDLSAVTGCAAQLPR